MYVQSLTMPLHIVAPRTFQTSLLYIIPAKYTGFTGIIPGFSVSSRYPGISAKYTGNRGLIPGFSVSSRNSGIIPMQHSHVPWCSTAGWPIEARAWLFSRMKKHFRVIFSDFGRISCDFWLDIRDFGKKCETKGNKEKSRNL